ncbi:MAG: electron transfer flavoprotein subunit alpha/FixB family protein [Oscillospiraceae bacterium]
MKVLLVSQAGAQLAQLCMAAQAAGPSAVQACVLAGREQADVPALAVDKITLLADDGPPLAERYLDTLEALVRQAEAELVLFEDSPLGNALATRLAWRCGGSCALGVKALGKKGAALQVTRSEYGCQLDAQLSCTSAPFFLSIGRDHFEDCQTPGHPSVEHRPLPESGAEWYTDYTYEATDAGRSLRDYDLVFVAGRGLGSKEACRALQALAEKLGAGLGATRPVVLNAWLPMHCMVGASGEIIAPKSCVTFGVSGCAPLLAGVQRAGHIAAVNTDAQAAMFDHCDVGVQADCNAIIQCLMEGIEGDEKHG